MHALSQLLNPSTFEGLKRGQAESMWRVREQARLQVESTGQDKIPVFELLDPERDCRRVRWWPIAACRPYLRRIRGDLFFDIEGDPFAFWEGLEYLFGSLGRRGDDLWDQDGYRGLMGR